MRTAKNTGTVDTPHIKKRPGRTYDRVTLDMYKQIQEIMRQCPEHYDPKDERFQ